MPRYVIRGQEVEADSVQNALKIAGPVASPAPIGSPTRSGKPGSASAVSPFGVPGGLRPLSSWGSGWSPQRQFEGAADFVPAAAVENTAGEHRRISNDSRIKPPRDPHPVENTLLFLPEYAVQELLLEPNMSDKGDAMKEMWFGRVWELRELLRVQHEEYLARVNVNKPDLVLTASEKQALDAMMQDPKKKSLLTKLCARWKGTVVRRRNSLRVLNRLKYSYLRGTVIYAHGSGGCSWDNFRLCRMMARMGMLVIAPDGFAYPKNTDLGKMRHKDVQPLKRATDDVDYWADDLLYASSAGGSHTYSTAAESVLDNPDKFRDLYEKCYQMRRRELHWTIEKLPRWIRTQGFFIGGTSEGAMTVSRFDDQRYGHQVLGRFINSFSIEYCYFTPTVECAQIGGNIAVPTLNIIGTMDEYFGATKSVAAMVQSDKERGFGDVKLDGHGFDMMMEQEVSCGLVCYLEGGKHAPCPSHDNFLRRLFQTFFTRPQDIWRIDGIWQNDDRTAGWLDVKKKRTHGQKLTLVQVPVMDHSKLTLEELDKLSSKKLLRRQLLGLSWGELLYGGDLVMLEWFSACQGQNVRGSRKKLQNIAEQSFALRLPPAVIVPSVQDIVSSQAAAGIGPSSSQAEDAVHLGTALPAQRAQPGVQKHPKLGYRLAVRSVARRAQMPFDLPPPKRREDYGDYGHYGDYGAAPGSNRRVRAFIRDLDMGEAALDLLQSLEEDLQIEIIEQFDIQGTRDGNVRSRFLSFLRALWCRRLGVNREVTDYLRDLPEEIQVEVIKEFDPRGTKDGNVSARLYSFAYGRIRGRAPKGLRDPHELEGFVRHWGLDSSAGEVLEALPDEVLIEVLQGFDASSTRDGNVKGRFLGYVRRKWAQHFELEDDCIYSIKRLPEECQILCLTTFDPWTTRDGNISARLRSFLWKIEAEMSEQARWYDNSSRFGSKSYRQGGRDRYDDYGYDYHEYDDARPRANRATRDAILKFVARWDLDLATGAYLENLKDPDVLARVLEEFDPTGTQALRDMTEI
ncbi:unnamed protein product [Symbiodinium natans]|uniref:Uncharacterized protein n=1 Tax=Symbiodinium natans TaxID=878477 RepID=A0A812PIS5_9DINO|nr:unnamed protein product [Symbiodinium natans]